MPRKQHICCVKKQAVSEVSLRETACGLYTPRGTLGLLQNFPVKKQDPELFFPGSSFNHVDADSAYSYSKAKCRPWCHCCTPLYNFSIFVSFVWGYINIL